jgi:hypothetical protein
MTIVMRRARAGMVFARGRERGSVTAWLFVVLLLLVAGERRLADAHFNARTGGLGIENDDALDGDEIRVRLIGLNDDRPPTARLHVGMVRVTLHVDRPARPCLELVGRPAPRAPPIASS